MVVLAVGYVPVCACAREQCWCLVVTDRACIQPYSSTCAYMATRPMDGGFKNCFPRDCATWSSMSHGSESPPGQKGIAMPHGWRLVTCVIIYTCARAHSSSSTTTNIDLLMAPLFLRKAICHIHTCIVNVREIHTRRQLTRPILPQRFCAD